LTVDPLTIVVLVVLIPFLVTASIGAVVQGCKIVPYMRAWLAARKLPLITVGDVTLSAMEFKWRLPEPRWPPPVTVDSKRMSPPLCRAYARTAASRSRVARYQGEVVLIISSAFLGFQLPGFLGDMPQMLTWMFPMVFGDLLIGDEPAGSALLAWMFALVPAHIGLIAGVALRVRSEDLEIARGYYQRTAEAREADELPAIAPAPRGGLKAFFGAITSLWSTDSALGPLIRP
jgi:hypothetical protein